MKRNEISETTQKTQKKEASEYKIFQYFSAVTMNVFISYKTNNVIKYVHNCYISHIMVQLTTI